MNTKIAKEILRENWWLMVGPIVFILMGILVIILTHHEKPVEYASLQTKEVTVETFSHHYGQHGSSYDYIRTTDGVKYTISGEYQQQQLKEMFTEGTTITIKWYQNKPFRTLLAEEIYIEGTRVVAYDNDKLINKATPLFVGICAILLALGSFCFVRFILVSISKKRKNM